ncbi:MAG: deoxyuridine 5'-triphosphate nucleotidohydrolase [Candidatus Bathyarchaeia archaeon]
MQLYDNTSAPIRGCALTRREILRRINSQKPLIKGYVDLATQLQPAGFELTVREVSRLRGAGVLDFSNRRRKISDLNEVKLESGAHARLDVGAYVVRYNEVIHLPLDLLALVFPRSSLLRCGATLYTAVWDPGYVGRGQGLLSVHNPHGLELFKNARICQMIFFKLIEPASKGYKGAYMKEGL